MQAGVSRRRRPRVPCDSLPQRASGLDRRAGRPRRREPRRAGSPAARRGGARIDADAGQGHGGQRLTAGDCGVTIAARDSPRTALRRSGLKCDVGAPIVVEGPASGRAMITRRSFDARCSTNADPAANAPPGARDAAGRRSTRPAPRRSSAARSRPIRRRTSRRCCKKVEAEAAELARRLAAGPGRHRQRAQAGGRRRRAGAQIRASSASPASSSPVKDALESVARRRERVAPTRCAPASSSR